MGQRRNHNTLQGIQNQSRVKHQISNLWDMDKIVHRDIFITLSAIIRTFKTELLPPRRRSRYTLTSLSLIKYKYKLWTLWIKKILKHGEKET